MIKCPEGCMTDARGAFIPVENIRPIDLKRDELVRELIEQAKENAGILIEFKNLAFTAIYDFVQESARELKVRKLGGVKGNVTLTSFDGQYKVISAYQDQITFDERLKVAKGLIDECIRAWSKGADNNLIAVVNTAFAVDREGNVNARRILELKRLDIDDSKWKKAMEAIAQAVQVTSSKNYVRFYERQSDGEYKQISLNIATD